MHLKEQKSFRYVVLNLHLKPGQAPHRTRHLLLCPMYMDLPAGLSSIVCISAPATEREAPATMAIDETGNLITQMITCAEASLLSSKKNVENTFKTDSRAGPVEISATRVNTHAIAPKTSKKYFRLFIFFVYFLNFYFHGTICFCLFNKMTCPQRDPACNAISAHCSRAISSIHRCTLQEEIFYEIL